MKNRSQKSFAQRIGVAVWLVAVSCLMLMGCSGPPGPLAFTVKRADSTTIPNLSGGLNALAQTNALSAGLSSGMPAGESGAVKVISDTEAGLVKLDLNVLVPGSPTSSLYRADDSSSLLEALPGSRLAMLEQSGGSSSEPAFGPTIKSPDRREVHEVLKEFKSNKRSIQKALERSGQYIPMIKEELASYGLPTELVGLPFIESSFNSSISSPANAVGMWQFIATTARAYMLRVDWWVDERLDPELSTKAALKHLSELYNKFGDWELVLAAYNAGSGGIARALAAEGAKNFWDLIDKKAIKHETSRYVPKFYAAMEIMKDPEAHGFVPTVETPMPEYDTVKVGEPVDISNIAKLSGVEPKEIMGLNPALRRGITPPGQGEYNLRVPVGMGEEISKVIAELEKSEQLEFKRHKVKSGETLAKIASKYDVSQDSIAKLNGISGSKGLKPGRELVVPLKKVQKSLVLAKKDKDAVDADSSYEALAPNATASADDGLVVHKVQKGDNVWSISKKYGVKPEEVLKANGLSKNSRLSLGQELTIKGWPKEKPAAKKEAKAKNTASVGEKFYVVSEGDTLWSISKKHGLTLAQLDDLNNLKGRNSLKLGERLLVSAH